MKKFLIIIIMLLIFNGCKKNSTDQSENVIITTTTTTITKSKYIDNNPIKLGFYMYHNSNYERELLKEYITPWILNQDLCSLEVFFTDIDKISGSTFQTIWREYFNSYVNIDKYKIGFNIQFETINGKVNQNILSPIDTDYIYNYMQIYLYDDVNQQIGNWYSHVTKEEFNDNTILSSIKLTGSTNTSDITSDIKLTVFTYDNDDFDENNNYRGNSSYEIIIKKQN